MVESSIHAQRLATVDHWHVLKTCTSTLILKDSTVIVGDAVLTNGGDIGKKMTFRCTSSLGHGVW